MELTTSKSLRLYAFLLLVASLSSFTDQASSEEQKKPEANPPITEPRPLIVPDDKKMAEMDERARRSREELSYGNQQNKPNGLVDDMMGAAKVDDSFIVVDDRPYEDYINRTIAAHAAKNKKDKKEEEEDKGRTGQQEDMMMMMGPGAVPPSHVDQMQYPVNTDAQALRHMEEMENSLYDQDIYRRKRQAPMRPISLRKRSLRSSLGQMMQKRGIRFPRRALRYKRQADMQDLMSLFGNERYFEEEAQVPRYSAGYPDPQGVQYPYIFQHRGQGVMTTPQDSDLYDEGQPEEVGDSIDDLMLMPPNGRYIDDGGLVSPYRSREEEEEAVQKWLARHTTPSVFRVSRRSNPFYPVDYRYVPGYKKRSGRYAGSHHPLFSGEEEMEEVGSDAGRWGRIVPVPQSYPPPEDVARLYGLASLMAEGDGEGAKSA